MIGLVAEFFKTLNSFIFASDEFECSLRVGRGLEFKVYERPGVWASDEKLAQLRSDIQTIARAGHGASVPPAPTPTVWNRRRRRSTRYGRCAASSCRRPSAVPQPDSPTALIV